MCLCSYHLHNVADMVGSLVFIFLIVQLLLAFVRPHPPEKGTPKTAIRAAWEAVHRTLGPIIMFMGMANVFVGLIMVDAPGWTFATLSLVISSVVVGWVTFAAAAARLSLPRPIESQCCYANHVSLTLLLHAVRTTDWHQLPQPAS